MTSINLFRLRLFPVCFFILSALLLAAPPCVLAEPMDDSIEPDTLNTEMVEESDVRASHDGDEDGSHFNDSFTSCQEIFDTSSYRKKHGFTEAPTKLGCHVGQAVGSIVAIPFALVYAPICAATDRGDCERAKTPIECGAGLFGRIIGYTVGAPFFLLETIFTSDKED